jgi:hypothetical protein
VRPIVDVHGDHPKKKGAPTGAPGTEERRHSEVAAHSSLFTLKATR